MAKNKNQNRQQRDQQQRDQRREPGMESQEPARGGSAEERVMPSGPQVTHKQQKRFGHN